MNCATLRAWLDDGMPESRAARARAHAAGCGDCAREFHAARALDAALAGAPSATFAAPAGFSDDVMARIATLRAARALPEAARPLLPWWVQVATQPATVLAFTLAGLLAWRGSATLDAGAALLAMLNAALAGAPGASVFGDRLPLLADPLIAIGVGAAALPLVAWLSYRLYGWSERLFVPRPA